MNEKSQHCNDVNSFHNNLCLTQILEKEMATHSSIFAWRILWTKETSRVQPAREVAKSHTQLSNYHSFNSNFKYEKFLKFEKIIQKLMRCVS